jgi:LCP family protein required for cell wall assembly
LRAVAVGTAIIVTGSTLTAYLAFRHEWNGIKRVDVRRDLSYHPRPPDPAAMNILLIGSDSRAGANKKFGAEIAGQRSDTVMVLHIAPGARQLVALSFPRDSVVPILSCAPENGSLGQNAQPAGYVEQINATFAYGGPGCLRETIEQTTGIHIDDFVELTFTGFEHVINDIGGVSVCLPVAIHDPDSLLNLSAGRHHVYGREALAFWRARYIGEGSDLQRINRDQYLMASLVQGLERSGLTHSPAKVLTVIRDLVSHGDVATDTQLTPSRLFTIAEELHSLALGAAGDLAAARTVAAQLKQVRLRRDPSLSGGTVQLILGSSFIGLSSAATLAATASPAASTDNLAGRYGGIRGNVAICSDAAAFAGPDGTN